MNTVCIFSHDCPFNGTKKCTVDRHDRRPLGGESPTLNSIPRSFATIIGPTACIQHDCIHVAQRSALLPDTDIRLIVKITAQSVRHCIKHNNTRHT